MIADAFQPEISNVYESLLPESSGSVADYIPILANVDPDQFALAVAGPDGSVSSVGDADTEFTLQSVSKPYVFALALLDSGPDVVGQHVGTEPTGDAFNAVTLGADGRPLNPMVNSGAIVTSGLVDGTTPRERIERIRQGLSAFAGRDLSIDTETAESEMASSDRNRAISYLMHGADTLGWPVEESLETYVYQCAVKVTVRDLAVMAATLANEGRNPITGELVIPAAYVQRVLSIMATCGMYDAAGQWLYRVGLPAKSGVSGAICAVVPNQLGIAAWSPSLDEHGNSVRAVAAAEVLSRRLALHLLSPTGKAAAPIRRVATGSVIHSRRGRSWAARQYLRAHGDRIRIIEVQGAVDLLAAATVLERIDELDLATVDTLIINLQRVSYLHSGAAELLRHRFAEIAKSLAVAIADPGELTPPSWQFSAASDLDEVLETAENRLLAGGPPSVQVTQVPLRECALLRELSQTDFEIVAAYVQELEVTRRTVVCERGAEAAGVTWVLAGEIDLYVPTHGHSSSTRLRGIGPGGVVGELTIVDGKERSVRTIARQDSLIANLSAVGLSALRETNPETVAALLRALSAQLVAQQRRSYDVIASFVD